MHTLRHFIRPEQRPAWQALQALAALGCNEVLIEAGPALTQAVRELGLWDEWVLIQQTAAGDTVTTTRNL